MRLFRSFVQQGIAYLNPNYTSAFEITEAHCALSAKGFKNVLRKLEPKILIRPSEAWRFVSFDEICIKMNTHGTDGTGSTRNCEQTIRDTSPGVEDKGEVLSAKSSCRMSVIGGSNAAFEGSPMYCSLAAATVDPCT